MRSFKAITISLVLASFSVTGVAHATGGHFGGPKKWVPHFVFHPFPHKPPTHKPPKHKPPKAPKPPTPPKAVPELSANGAGSALALLLGVGAVLTPVARRRLSKQA